MKKRTIGIGLSALVIAVSSLSAHTYSNPLVVQQSKESSFSFSSPKSTPKIISENQSCEFLQQEQEQEQEQNICLPHPQKTYLEKDHTLYDYSTPTHCLDPQYNYSDKDLRANHKLVDKCISYSKKRKTFCLVLDKAAYKLDLYRKGKLEISYNVDLGYNPHGARFKDNCKGCTPEGMFRARHKKHTKYYKALLFKYPEYFEIHGYGKEEGCENTNRNWTFGCIAMCNLKMDDLYKRTKPQKHKRGIKLAIVKYAHSDLYYCKK